MKPRATERPAAEEYHEFYNDYIQLVPDGEIVSILKDQLSSSRQFLEAIPEDRHGYRYAAGKWTTQQVLRHIIDVEWIFSYRALSFGRGAKESLPGMEQNEFMAGADQEERTMASLIEEYSQLRSANTALFDGWSDAILARTGVASDCDFSVRSILYVIAGHERHHLEVIRQRYL